MATNGNLVDDTALVDDEHRPLGTQSASPPPSPLPEQKPVGGLRDRGDATYEEEGSGSGLLASATHHRPLTRSDAPSPPANTSPPNTSTTHASHPPHNTHHNLTTSWG